jgi:hypothetical protein
MEKNLIIKIVFLTVLSFSFITNIALTFLLVKTINNLNSVLRAEQVNYNILSFANMFVEKVLLAEGEVDFDTRLELETTVRSLNNKEIFSQWQKFTKSLTKIDAGNEAKILLDLLIKEASTGAQI